MQVARTLNIITIGFFIVSLIISLPILIYISIGFLAASMIYWRTQANKIRKEE